MRFSITFKTASIYTLVFSAILLVLSLVIVGAFGVFLLNESKSSLAKNAEIISEILGDGNNIPEAKIKKYANIEGIDVRIFDKQKALVYSTGDSSEDPSLLQVKLNNPSQVFLTSDEFIHLKTQPVLNNRVYFLLLSKSLSLSKDYLLSLLLASTITFTAAVILTVLIGSRTLRKMLKPIDNMIGTARLVSANNLRTRLNVVDSHDELKDLAETFNEMLDRIQLSYEQQNRFVSDASHELRTPISVIQGYANLLQRWGKEDKQVLDEAVSAIKNEAENMKDLVEKLLFLARADKATQKLEMTQFALHELVDEVLKETRMIDSEHEILSETNLAMVTTTMEADRRLIKQALRIFIDNSIKHTPKGGVIKIDGYLRDHKIKFIIEDNGTGISREDLPYIFDRFYKCDKSRTRESGGLGLGLSIAKWIIEKHKGTIGVESTPGQGTTITVSLPV